ncbi:PaaI family thioesterase [Streptomyces sp. NPDC046821]|uniref:PaaI family thioesterase n=1 Tax=Streptomyces sp. NPDC046821 TaxID=3154702 RepID=UPI0033EC4E08
MGAHGSNDTHAYAWGTGTGLDRIRLLAEELDHAPHVPYTQFGLRITRAGKGIVELSWTPGETLLNRGRVVHGGFIATTLDETCGVAVMSGSEPLTPYLTMSLNVEYLRPVRAGATYTVIGRVLKPGRVRTLVRATVEDDTGRLCAEGTAAMTPNHALLERSGHGSTGTVA